MPDPYDDHSIENEPHLGGRPLDLDPSEQQADRILARDRLRQTDDQCVEHSVWDEPALAVELTGKPTPGELTYADWLTQRIETTTAAKSWMVTAAVAASAGLLAVLGTLLRGGGDTAFGVVALTVVGPLVEEMMKIAVALWVVEKRPYLFRSAGQIVLCGLAGGLAFAAIENALYLLVYIPDASSGLILWRWTICVALHTGCACGASFGLARVWRRTMQQRSRPQLSLASPFLVAAVVVHGVYNASALLLEGSGFDF